MSNLSYPRYQRTEFGSLVFLLRPDDADPMRVTETLGITYDAADGTMQKHGEAERVRPSFTRLRQAFDAAGIDKSSLRMVELPVEHVEGELLEQINRMMAISGYATRFDQWLQHQITPTKGTS